MRRCAIVLLPVLVFAVSAVPAGGASGPVATCADRVATIVTDGLKDVVGTDGDDVVVAHDAKRVDVGGGDDTVCLTSSPESWPLDRVTVLAGPGDDFVDASTVVHNADVELGAGADTLLGSASNYVNTGDLDDLAAGNEPSTDRVKGGAGFDLIFSGTAPGSDSIGSRPNTDVISTGKDGDSLFWGGLPVGEVDGGRSADDDVQLFAAEAVAWSVDLRAEVVSTPAGTARLRGVERVQLADLGWQSFVFRGTNRADDLDLLRPREDNGVLRVRLRGGRDYFSAHDQPVGRGITAVGGRGHDHLEGSAAADRLRGGQGRDTVIGESGRDTCRAERTTLCEN